MLLQRPLSVTIGRRGTENSPPVEDLTQKDKEKDNEKEKEKERVNEVEQKEGDGSKEKSLTPRPANVKARRLSIGPSFLHRLGKSKSDVGKRPKVRGCHTVFVVFPLMTIVIFLQSLFFLSLLLISLSLFLSPFVACELCLFIHELSKRMYAQL